MKKQKISKIIFLSLVLILVMSIIFLLKGEKTGRTKVMYEKIANSNEYTFTMEEKGAEDLKFIMSKADNSRSIDVTSGEEHTTTLVKDGYAYFVMHEQEEYYTYSNSEAQEIEADILEEGLKNIEEANYTTGKEKIYGKTYYYEEYEDMESFLMVNTSLDEQVKSKTRFYFDGDNIVYIKTIIDENDEELLKIDCKYLADKDLFEIPANYAEL